MSTAEALNSVVRGIASKREDGLGEITISRIPRDPECLTDLHRADPRPCGGLGVHHN